MKNRYEDKFGKPDKEEEGRRAACEKSQREEGMGGAGIRKGSTGRKLNWGCRVNLRGRD